MNALDAAIEQAENMDRIHRKHRKDLLNQVRTLFDEDTEGSETLRFRITQQDPNFLRKLYGWPSDLGFGRIAKALKLCKMEEPK